MMREPKNVIHAPIILFLWSGIWKKEKGKENRKEKVEKFSLK